MMKFFMFLLFACGEVLSDKREHIHGNNPIIETVNGKLEGVRCGTRSGREISKFMGIQYAIINERFTPSAPVSSWNETKPAKNFGPSCQDVEKHRNEQCLYLNVYTHYDGQTKNDETEEIKTRPLHPVVVYFHGGSFKYNSGDLYGHRYLLDEDVVLVTVNYRLGVLGFLSTGCVASPGNYGLMDQVMSLRWIQDNIAAFGGDKDRVTIMGQSAGSASVTYHLVSPMSQGLFKNAIAESGTFLDPWAFTRNPMKYAKKLAERLECPELSSSEQIMNCLKSLPVETIANYDIKKEVARSFYADPLAAFGPVIEPPPQKAGQVRFLPQSPYELLVSGNVSKVPLLTGVTDQEGAFLWAVPLLIRQGKREIEAREALQENFAEVASIAFYFNETASSPEQKQEVAEKIKKIYFGEKGFDLKDYDHTLPSLVKLYGDRLFAVSHYRFTDLYSKQAPTYPYIYTFNKFPSFESQISQAVQEQYKLGATHAAELDMLFSPLFGKTNPNAEDPDFQQLSESIVKLWVSFISEGKPSATYGSEKNFPKIDPEEGLQQYYRLDQDTSLVSNPFVESIKFWDTLNLSDTDFLNNNEHELEDEKENEKSEASV